MKSSYFFVFLAVILHCNCDQEDDKIFTMIFATRRQIHVGTSENFTASKNFKEFDQEVTSLAVNKDYFDHKHA